MLSIINSLIARITFKNSAVFIFLTGATLLFYGNVLFGDFVFDDNIFIENNVQIRSLSSLGQIYRSSTTAGSGLTGDNFYRPNQQFIYALLYSFFGLSPFFFHLVPMLFHILNGYLIFLLFTRLGISRRSAFFGSLLFLLHPVLTEAVSYISGLSEPLVLSTILVTLLLFLKSTKKLSSKGFLKTFFLGALIFGIGLFSKENQSVALGLIGLIAIVKYKRGELYSLSLAVLFIGALVTLSVFYFYLRLDLLNFTGVLGLTSEANIYTESLYVRLLTFLHVLPEYFKMMIFPWHLYYEKPYFFISSLTLRALLSIAIIILGAVFSLVSIIKRRGEVFFGLGWFAVAMVPFVGLVPLNAIYLEHWLYIPIVGLIFYLSYFFDRHQDFSKNILPPVLIIVLLLFGARVIARNWEWRDPVKFYENELRYTQTSARLYANLGMELSDRGDCAIATLHYRRAIATSDIYSQTHHNLARCLEQMGEIEGAFNEYLKALQLQPDFPYSINALEDLIRRYPHLLNSSNR